MRIIQRQELKETEITCERCLTLFAYNLLDIESIIIECGNQITHSHSKRGNVVKCPICNLKIKIDLVTNPDNKL